MAAKKYTDIDEYIADFPEETQKKLQQVRAVIRDTVPEAEETIKYNMPTFMLNGNLVYFAGYKNHIGFYGAPTGVPEFEKALKKYKQGKGSLQFPLDQPMPVALIAKIVKWRKKANLEKAKEKKSTLKKKSNA